MIPRLYCPECYAPIAKWRHGKDGRCKRCRRMLQRQRRAHSQKRVTLQ